MVDEGEGSEPQSEAVGTGGAGELEDVWDEEFCGSSGNMQTSAGLLEEACEWLGLWECPNCVRGRELPLDADP